MAETRRKLDQDFKEGAVRLVRETGNPIAQVVWDLPVDPMSGFRYRDTQLADRDRAIRGRTVVVVAG